ncbi:MAG: helix-turn-helix domain-containing protein [Bacillus sp. (in: firmicutes)]
MESLGERIRTLRKQRKLTLTDVAEEKMTKGMLSLIENGKAKPSMESLQHIAQKLGVTVADLVDRKEIERVREVLESAESSWKDSGLNSEELAKNICSITEPVLSQLGENYESGRLLELYSRSLFLLHEEEAAVRYMNEAEKVFKTIHLYNEYAKMASIRALVQFHKGRYQHALDMILHIRNEIVDNGWHLSETTKVELNYYEAILYYAIGDYGKGKEKVKESLSLLQETGIYYFVDELYRVAILDAMMQNDEERKQTYMKKLQQYAEFAENNYSRWYLETMKIHDYIQYKKEYEKGMELLTEALKRDYGFSQEEEVAYRKFRKLDEVAALYGMAKYQEALDAAKEMPDEPFLNHPFDLSIYYQMFAHKALCYLELGQHEEALKEIRKASRMIDPMPSTPYKELIIQAEERIEQETAAGK